MSIPRFRVLRQAFSYLYDRPNKDGDKFDYIVVGAGSAGCAVAGRLGEADHAVLLLEVGGKDPNPFIYIPLHYSMLYANKSVNWR
ncbi:hypothetical protein OAN307_c36330 [Octadecabacter antarcticus 307]|uniref:Uncharacterized protein n=1 Tax=Octadecabacter antarcticus 307 TaxID=391626 RepID=M9RA85_9RHOB|nr:hypothetical protein OAN307_c36330 [Octadecabacter antarcticus 307]